MHCTVGVVTVCAAVKAASSITNAIIVAVIVDTRRHDWHALPLLVTLLSWMAALVLARGSIIAAASAAIIIPILREARHAPITALTAHSYGIRNYA